MTSKKAAPKGKSAPKDDRLKRGGHISAQSSGSDEASQDRAPRGVHEDNARADEGLVMSSEERRAMLRNEWLAEALPKPPEIPGWHLCYLSTTNQYDPIHKRMRIGYVPVKAEELVGFDAFKVHSGEHTGHVAINEMVLFKIPNELYQDIMAELHHYQPLEEERRIKERIEALAEERDSTGKSLVSQEGEGISELGKNRRVPNFLADAG